MRDLQQLAQIYCQRAAQEWECLPAETGQQAPLRDVFFHLQAVQEKERRRPEEMSDLPPSEQSLKSAGLDAARRKATEDYSPTPVGKVLKDQKRLVILGEPGAGKSTLLQFIGLTYARGAAAVQEEFGLNEALIPVRVSLQLAASAMLAQPKGIVSVLEEAVWALLPGERAEAKALLVDWIDRRRLAVLLDGLDEIPTENRSGVLKQIRALHNKLAGGDSRIIIASRRAGYAEYPPGKPFAEFSLVPLRPEQAQQYLQNWLLFLKVQDDERRAASILEVVRQHPALRRMSDNPLVLKLLALHFQEKDEQQASLTDREKVARSRAELYRSWLRHAWKRARERGATGEYQTVEETLVRLAWDQQMENPGELFDADQKLVREQMGLVAHVGNGRIVFAHKTVQEYLVALRLQECWVKHQKWTKRFLQLRLHLPEWREPLLLLAGSLEKPEIDALVHWTLNAKSPGESRLLRDFILAGKMILVNPLADGSEVHKRGRKRIRHRNPGQRESAAMALGAIGGPETVSALREALKDTDGDVRRAAARALGAIGGLDAVAALQEALKDTDGDVRRTAARALGAIGGLDAVAALQEALKDTDGDVRCDAAQALGEIGGPEAASALREALKDMDLYVRLTAAECLGEIGSPEDVPALREALKDSDKNVREVAAEALMKIGGPDAVAALREALKDSDKNVREVAAEVLMKIGGPDAMAALRKALKHAHRSVRRTAAVAHREIGSPDAVAALLEALKDTNGYIRRNAARALGAIGGPEAVSALREALKDTEGYVCWTAAVALGEIGSSDAVVALREASKDSDKNVRKVAAEALMKIGGPDAVAALREALKDSDKNVREVAAEALMKIGRPEAVAALREALNHTDTEVRWYTARVLGAIGGPEATSALQEALKDMDGSVRYTAAEALMEIGSPDAVAALREALKDPYEEVRDIATEALIKIGSPEVVAALQEALKDTDGYMRRNAARALGEIGGPEAVADLRKVLNDTKEDVRQTAARALGEINGQEVVVDLREALKDRDGYVRWTAANSIIIILNNPNNLHKLTNGSSTLRQIVHILKKDPLGYSQALILQARYKLLNDAYTDPCLPPPISQRQRIATDARLIAFLFLASGLIRLVTVYMDTAQDRYEAEIARTWVALIPRAWLLPIVAVLAGLLVVVGVLLIDPVKDMVKEKVWKKEKAGK